MSPALTHVVELFESRGHLRYSGEGVSQLEHALQTASLAEADRASPCLVTAALLHDVGHLLSEAEGGPTSFGRDDRHQMAAIEWLGSGLPEQVLEPIRLHVDAKRYLCFARADYQASLSSDSALSLALQGGAFSATAAADFLKEPFAEDAIRLRFWDDGAKVAGLRTPDLAYFIRILENCRRASED